MDVSVIFATHNREDVLKSVFEAWRVVERVTKYKYEIICSDDESTDKTIDIIQAVKDLPIRLICNKKGGAAKARNAALKIANGKIVIFTGDDMFPEPDFINKHFENYLKFGEKVATLGRIEWHPDIKMNYLMHHITNVGCEQFGFVGLPPYQLIDYRHFYTSNISVPISQLKSLDRFFNTDFDKYGFEDIELGYRLEEKGMHIYYDPDIVITHHHVYNSVDKFCVRHMTAGEELVVFHDMHPELEDRCIYDVDDIRRTFALYKKNHSEKVSLKGKLVLASVGIAKDFSKILEKLISWNRSSVLTRFESILYAGIFKFSFLYGCVMRIAQGESMHPSRLAHFAYLHMKKGYMQIYWDTGYGMNEEESRKWLCWDAANVTIEKVLPPNVKSIRISPLKNRCTAQMTNIIIEKQNGEAFVPPIAWHNAQATNWVEFDFRNTNDPQVVIEDIPTDYRKIIVQMSVNSMKKKSLYMVARHAAHKIKQKIKTAQANRQSYSAQYVSGQPRRIQICIAGLDDDRRGALVDEYKNAIKALGDSVVIADAKKKERGYVTYQYKPEAEPLDGVQILQVAYLLLNAVYDYVIVSKSFAEFPLIGCKELNDVLIFSEMIDIHDNEKVKAANGRYMRLPAFDVIDETLDLREIWGDIRLQQGYYLTNDKLFKPEFRQSKRCFRFEKKKPVVFVNPIFLAVGGVERNTIEVMRALKDDYTFCLLTMEPHSRSQGSLHFQLKGICDYIFDLREITEFQNYLACLYELKQIFEPDIFWLCNNSPWFEVNTSQIRKIFDDVAMIAQDVYDTQVGWIEYYKNPELKLFDRYIAVTQLIRDTFINKYQIADDRIDVIYSAIDGARIRNELQNDWSYDELCETYGLNKNKKHFAFVGRLTDQKNPIRFLELAEQLKVNSKKNIQFVMVGDGKAKDEVAAFISDKGLQDYVLRIPFVENTPQFIRVLDGLILTSVYEGMPIVSIEAMCMSTPIFSTDTGDLRRFLEKNKSGYIIDEQRSDYDNFICFIDNLADYKANAEQHAREMLDYFSADHMAGAYRESFKKGMQKYRKEE